MIHCAAIFTDHMLLQRGKPIAVFGTGTAGEPVTVSVPQRHCTVSSAVRQDGTWRVTLPPMPAGTGCTLTVNEQEFSDVAFGEVWLAGGQSNMEFMLKDARNGTAELEQIISETKQDEEKLREKAKKLEANIEPRLLTAFKRIRKGARNGLAVVYVQRGACGGCFNKIPPQKQLDIKLRKKVIVCEYCGRIMIDPELAGIEE